MLVKTERCATKSNTKTAREPRPNRSGLSIFYLDDNSHWGLGATSKVGNPPDSADRRHRCEWLLRGNKPSSFATVPSDTPDYHVQKGAELA